jgi:hypothetical protein
MAYRPQIGESGIFKLLAPYNILLTPDKLYTCQSIRTINDFIASGESVFDRYYAPLGVAQDIYQNDLANNSYIVGLQAGTGEWVYVPSSFINDAPVSNGVKYISAIIGASLGPIPDTFNLEGIIEEIKGIVRDKLGVESQVKGIVVGSPRWLTNEEHDLLETARQNKLNLSDSDKVKIQKLENKVREMQAVLVEYEKIFKTTIV